MSSKRKVALTFDLEFWHETDWLKPYLPQDARHNIGFEQSVLAVTGLLKTYGQHATFFTTDTVVRAYPQLIQEIARDGHEIASHGIGHTRLPLADPLAYAVEFNDHIKRLQSCSGKKILGFRAPHFSLTNESSWIIPTLAENGLRYDSSIMPSAVAEYGNKAAPMVPYLISKKDVYSPDQDSDIMEIPMSVFGPKIRIPFSGGIYFRILPYRVFRFFMNKVIAQKRLPILYFHPHELDPDTPRITYGPILKRYLKYFGIKKSRTKFERILKEYSCDSIEHIFFRA